ncbi:hypothetical protein FNV43_RR26620 [Rhamnella rubrinervis]|uniref:UspA domain-containing protein n=1 Tax=Rhamnella rubrinervis TaxID=2594499 RepID=A0A8K0DPN4_9ROSA|nr:hypothetical protein FNV43_RR26620 [Rhamnella rubrinervis]
MEKEKEGKCKRKKVMVAIDESESSYYALIWVLENLKESISTSPLVIFATQPLLNSNHFLVSAGSLSFATIYCPLSPTTALMKRKEEINKKVSVGLLEKARSICASRGVAVETFTKAGDPKEMICNIVENYKINLLVIGESTCGALSSATMGEATTTARAAEKKVMVAIDESEYNRYALIWVLENLKDSITKSPPLLIFMAQLLANNTYTFSASLGSARLCCPVSSTSEFFNTVQENHKKLTLAFLEKAKYICATHGILYNFHFLIIQHKVIAETVTEVGDPKAAISDAVQKYNIKLLVLGELGVGKLQRAILGSVSNYCVQNAECHVLLVKKPK